MKQTQIQKGKQVRKVVSLGRSRDVDTRTPRERQTEYNSRTRP